MEFGFVAFTSITNYELRLRARIGEIVIVLVIETFLYTNAPGTRGEWLLMCNVVLTVIR
ncbi:MAG: hypothetical protein BWX80_01670 [Candidatus Hydrogenedentes bacterium ADurb.Bin101]|nr:MAG: hypothetical protein BWX80_01670 [Candidatus Hydrogenedentes bacterium ADurb.Bin101]